MRKDWENCAKSIGDDRVLWYDAQGAMAFPAELKGLGCWLVNGRLFPIVNWDAADGAARRHDCDVLVFGPPGSVSSSQYPESLVVDDSGRVLKVERHYFDSPAFTDVAYGPISFCYVSGTGYAKSCAHLLSRGWSLESIRTLSESATVEWCAAPSVLSSMAGAEWRKGQVERAEGESGLGRAAPQNGTAVLDHGPVDAEETQRISPARKGRGVEPPSKPNSLGGVFGNGAGSQWASNDSPTLWGQPSSAQVGIDAPRSRIYPYLKRAIDIVFSLLALIVTLPLFVVLAILVKWTSPGPVFYADRRQGKGGREFQCYKFRTMVADAAARQAELRKLNEVDGPQFKMTDDPRLTGIGRWLRKYNVDELPQFINVFLGQMSLVGPRPSPDRENQLCPGWRRTRLSLRPGITGLWQVLRLRDSGPSDFQEWIYYDLEYARHQSFWLDCLILAYTPFTICGTHRLANLARKLAKKGICVEADVMHQRRNSLG